MVKLPGISGEEVIHRLEKLGFVKVRQRGSHVVLKKTVQEHSLGCVVPLRKSLSKGTLRGILRQANVSPEDFEKAE
jgi:predicted RNA binding protein YcfA (HicA-like mRNA interferase family)